MTVAYGFDYPVTPELKARVTDVLTRRIHHSGPYTRAAEHRIAQAFGCTHAVAVNSGSSACLLILRALAIGPGDEVLVPATSYITPAEATVLCGARPIFVECEPDTLNMDVNAANFASHPWNDRGAPVWSSSGS